MAVFNSSTDGLDLCISYLCLYYKFQLRNKVAVFNSSIHMLMALICGCASLWPLVVSCNQLAGGEGGYRGEKVRDAEITFLDSCYSALRYSDC